MPHKFLSQQLILMDEHSFLHKNKKLAPKWSGPHKIVRLKGDANVEIQLKHNNCKTVVHANRPKPYFVAYKNLAVHPDFLPALPSPQQWSYDVNPPLPKDYTKIHRTLLPTLGELRPTQTSPTINPQMQNPAMPPRRTRTSSTSSTASRNLELPDDVPPAMRTHSNASANSTPVKTHIILPQVMFHPLPVLQEGEGLEVDKSEIDTNDGITVNFVDGDSSWTLVRRCKKKS
jgi:hypothetical protein